MPPAHFGVAFSLAEGTVGLAMVAFLLFNIRNVYARIVLGLAAFCYLALPLAFFAMPVQARG